MDSGNTAVIHLNYGGLTSGVTFRRIYKGPVGTPTVLFNLDNVWTKNFPNLKTTDAGYTWSRRGYVYFVEHSGLVYLLHRQPRSIQPENL